MKGTSAGIKALIIIFSVLNVLAAAALVFLIMAPNLANAAGSPGSGSGGAAERMEAGENQTRGLSLSLENVSYRIQGTAPSSGTGTANAGGAGFSAGGQMGGQTGGVQPGNGYQSGIGTIYTDYILPDSNSRYYTRSELEVLTDEELYYARNEIYARLGRKFSTAALQQYFDAKPWYVPRYEPAVFDRMGESVFNQYERANLNLIIEIEGAR